MNRQTVVVIALVVIAVMNVVYFSLMGIDKRRARRGVWRISEKALFLTTACFGGLGGVLGMNVFHHKTKHWYFRVFFPVLLIVQIALLAAGVYLLMR
jgi:uncharacterized membrane protein YsdA (DUF1294 family)